MKILIKPEIAKGLNQNSRIPIANIAKKMGISIEEYEEIEQHGREVEQDQAEELAQLYGKNWSVFLLNDAPARPNYDEDHRSIKNQTSGLGYKTYAALEDADYLINFIVEVNEDDENKIPVFSTRITPKEMANEFRKVTGNSISTEPSFKTTAAAIKHWINQLAKLGINVASHPLGEDDGIRAFSLYRSTKAIIVLNSDETDNGKLFSLMHELSHILLRNTGVCDLKRSEIENFCNRFASEILIPDGILSQLIEKYDVSDENSEDTSGKIARRLRVSKLAVLTRLLQEKIIKPTTYDKLSVEEYKKFNSLKQNKIERQKKNAASGKSSGVNPYLLNKARIGNYFLVELFNAYNSGKITPFEAGKYLGFKPKTINKFSEWASHNEV